MRWRRQRSAIAFLRPRASYSPPKCRTSCTRSPVRSNSPPRSSTGPSSRDRTRITRSRSSISSVAGRRATSASAISCAATTSPIPSSPPRSAFTTWIEAGSMPSEARGSRSRWASGSARRDRWSSTRPNPRTGSRPQVYGGSRWRATVVSCATRTVRPRTVGSSSSTGPATPTPLSRISASASRSRSCTTALPRARRRRTRAARSRYTVPLTSSFPTRPEDARDPMDTCSSTTAARPATGVSAR